MREWGANTASKKKKKVSALLWVSYKAMRRVLKYRNEATDVSHSRAAGLYRIVKVRTVFGHCLPHFQLT